MSIKEYISSGMIETCILGLASEQEQAEFEKMCRQHPEVLEARISFEMLLEKQAMDNAVPPPSGLKEKIWNEITLQKTNTKVISLPDENRDAAPVRPIRSKTSWLKIAAAACFILLAGSLYWNYSLYNSNKQLKADRDGYVTRLSDIEKDMAILVGNENIKMAKLDGLAPAPKSFTTVYWDTTTKDVYLMINNLPKPADSLQYQLWAILDGKPVNAGLIENKYLLKQSKLLIKTKNVQNAQSFAITLEKKNRADITVPGGTMYAMGKLSL